METVRNWRGFVFWFWCFAAYSFAGFLLETAFAALTGGHANRKGLLVLPLCPVYGAGACLILALPGWVDARPWALFLLGGLSATAAEYLAALWHEKALGVVFWDYSGLPGNVGGRVCLPFSLAWGILSALAVWGVQPAVARLAAHIPTAGTCAFLLLFLLDTAFSVRFLWVTHDVEELRLTGWSL